MNQEELHTFKSGAFLPAAQAFLSGVFFSLVVLGVSLLAGAEQEGVFLLLGGSTVAFVAWLVLLKHWVRLVDLREGVQPAPRYEVIEPEPAFQPGTVRVALVERGNGTMSGEFLELPATSEQLRLLASGVVSGGSLSENAWCGSGRPFTKAQFHALRQALLERGWFQWRSPSAPAQGVEPTHVGRRVFQHLSETGNYLLPTRQEQDW